MVPDVAKAGHSFTGAMAYYLHDKRQGDGPQPTTAERVAWTETRNLATDDPEVAKRIMIATALQADALKAAAGIRATGRKSAAHVYAYALAWHPSEAGALDKAEMLRAADESLKMLGAEDHQALIVCHTDRAHPHVHIIINRVSPADGRMLSTSNDFRKLSAWANAYERERGQILTPAREEVRRAQDAFQEASAGPKPDKPPTARPEARKSPSSKTPSEAEILKDLTDAQKAQHRQDWADLSARNKDVRAVIYASFQGQIRVAAAQHKELSRPVWAAHFRAARSDARAFGQREQETVGIIKNALEVAKAQMRDGSAPGRGILSLTFANVISAERRAVTFASVQERERLALAKQLRAALDADVSRLKDDRARALAQQRQGFDAERAALIVRHSAERERTRDAWRQVYARRGKNPHYPMWQKAMQQEQMPMRKEFDDKSKGRAAAPPTPTERRFVNHAAPAPSPSGGPSVQHRKVEEVPAKDWGALIEAPSQTPSPKKDWDKLSEPVKSEPGRSEADRPPEQRRGPTRS